MRATRLALTLALLCGCPLAGAAKDRALVIGINSYPGITERGIPSTRDLTGAVFDAKTFETLLKEQFSVSSSDIHVLTETAATRDAILSEFQDWLIDGTAAGDRVFFYFAGHGVALSVRDEDNGGSRMTSAIVPADAKGELVLGKIENLIPGTEIRTLLDKLAGRRVTVIADSCQSGSVSRGITASVAPSRVRARTLTPGAPLGMTVEQFNADRPMRLRTKLNGRLLEIEPSAPTEQTSGDLAVWAAATVSQVTFDLDDGSGGIFTQSFAKGLRKKGAVPEEPDQVTPNGLLKFVRSEAQQFCNDHGAACRDGLTPQLLSKDQYLTAPLLGGPGNGGGSSAKKVEPLFADLQGDALAKKLSAILAHKNDFALDASILPSTQLKLGDPIRFKIMSGEAGKVAVFDVGPDGAMTQVFPNQKTGKDGRIRANTPLTMPDAFWGIQFKATPPAGPGSLLVLVTEDGVNLNRATDGSLDLKPIKSTSRLLEIIAAETSKPVVSQTLEEPVRTARFAFVRIPYTIAP